jgi:hypothetical protein
MTISKLASLDGKEQVLRLVKDDWINAHMTPSVTKQLGDGEVVTPKTLTFTGNSYVGRDDGVKSYPAGVKITLMYCESH